MFALVHEMLGQYIQRGNLLFKYLEPAEFVYGFKF
jgi:hypothetical protein